MVKPKADAKSNKQQSVKTKEKETAAATCSKAIEVDDEENKMEEDLRGTAEKEPRFFCGVCLAPFTRRSRAPVSLNCGHVFCARCVPKMYRRGEGENQNNGGGQPGEGATNGASKLLLQCGSCRAITYSKAGQLKKCVMLAELIEKEGEMGESEADEEEVKGKEEEGTKTADAPIIGGPYGAALLEANQLNAWNPVNELNTYYRHTALAELREKTTRALELGNTLRENAGPRSRLSQAIGMVELVHTLVGAQLNNDANWNIPFPAFARKIDDLGRTVTETVGRFRNALEAEANVRNNPTSEPESTSNDAQGGNNRVLRDRQPTSVPRVGVLRANGGQEEVRVRDDPEAFNNAHDSDSSVWDFLVEHLDEDDIDAVYQYLLDEGVDMDVESSDEEEQGEENEGREEVEEEVRLEVQFYPVEAEEVHAVVPLVAFQSVEAVIQRPPGGAGGGGENQGAQERQQLNFHGVAAGGGGVRGGRVNRRRHRRNRRRQRAPSPEERNARRRETRAERRRRREERSAAVNR